MKKILLFVCSALLIGFSSCSSDDEDEPINDIGQQLKKEQIELKGNPNDTDNKISFTVQAKKISVDWGDGEVDDYTPNGNSMSISHVYANPNYKTILISAEEITTFAIRYKEGKIQDFRTGDCPNLKELRISDQALAVFKMNQCSNLIKLYCPYNKLYELNLTNLSKLETLICDNNSLRQLDITMCPNLKYLDCQKNVTIAKLIMKDHSKLEYVDLEHNKFSADQLDYIFEKLPIKNGWINIISNLGEVACNRQIAINKGWTVD